MAWYVCSICLEELEICVLFNCNYSLVGTNSTNFGTVYAVPAKLRLIVHAETPTNKVIGTYKHLRNFNS